MTDADHQPSGEILVHDAGIVSSEQDSLENLWNDVRAFSGRRRATFRILHLAAAFENTAKTARAEQTLEEFNRLLARERARSRGWRNTIVPTGEEWVSLIRDRFPAGEPGPERYIVARPRHRQGLPEDEEAFIHADETTKHAVPVVRLSSLLKKGAIFVGGLCAASLVYWGVSGVIILNPFLAVLVAVGMPFVYLMGRRIDEP